MRFYKPSRYSYTLVTVLEKAGLVAGQWRNRLLFILRALILIFLVTLVARPQLIDPTSAVKDKGVAIMLALDLSGSMQLFDDMNDKSSRIKTELREARQFIEKREHDPIGLTFFAQDVIARAPLTHDKQLLKEILDETQLGVINPNGTKLAQGLLVAAQRLKNTQAASKIIILLTDGAPSPDDLDPRQALSVVKKLGIKVYTIGIGDDQGGFVFNPHFNVISRQNSPLNKELLQLIAAETGGAFFEAKKPQDMGRIYQTIDNLEKTGFEKPLYQHYHELAMPLLWLVLLLLSIEIILRCFLWRII